MLPILNKDKFLNFSLYNLLLGLILYGLSFETNTDDWIFHQFYCVSGLIIYIDLYLKMKKIDNNLYIYLSDIRYVFIISYLISYVFGSSILVFGTEVQITTKMDEYVMDAGEAVYVDFLNSIGLGLAIGVCSLYKPQNLNKIINSLCQSSLRVNINFFIYFSLIFGFLTQVYIFYFDISAIDQVLSGSIRQLKYLVYVGILVGILNTNKSSTLHKIIIAVTILSSLLGIINFNKGDFILPTVIFLTSLSIKNNSKRLFLVAIMMIFVMLTAVGGATLYARASVYGINPNSFSDRLSLIIDGVSIANNVNDYEKYNSWGRFTLINAQASSVKLYDTGDGGDDAEKFLWVAVPRIIYPNKPVLSQSGGDLYTKMTGNIGSSTAQGVFINGYYNNGFIGLLLYSIICGLIISQLTSISSIIVRKKAYAVYPIMLFCILIGSNTAGVLLTDYIGLFITLITTIFIFYFISKIHL